MATSGDITPNLASLGSAGWTVAKPGLPAQPTLTKSINGYQLNVAPIATVLFGDNFNGTTIDTVSRWSAPVLAGTGTMTQASGNLIATVGTTASNGAAINTQETFEPFAGGVLAGSLLNLEAAPGLNTNRCMGFYTRPGSFTAATPVQDGYVWELDITGQFGVSIYSGGTRIFRQVFPTNGETLIVALIVYQALTVDFYLRDVSTPVLSVPVLQPSTLNLPLGFHCINHTSGPAVAPTWASSGIAVVDQSGAIDTIFNGQNLTRARSPNKFINLNGVVITSETTIWTPAAGRKFRLMGYVLTGGVAAGNIILKDGTGGSTILIVPNGAAGATIVSPPMGNGILSAAANNVLTATGASTETLSGYLFGTEE